MRQGLLFHVAVELRSGIERRVRLPELLDQPHSEDLDRVLEGIAIRWRRAFRGVTGRLILDAGWTFAATYRACSIGRMRSCCRR